MIEARVPFSVVSFCPNTVSSLRNSRAHGFVLGAKCINLVGKRPHDFPAVIAQPPHFRLCLLGSGVKLIPKPAFKERQGIAVIA